jgi:hypothetical protein
MTSGIRGPAVIDTGVFAARLTPSGSSLASVARGSQGHLGCHGRLLSDRQP